MPGLGKHNDVVQVVRQPRLLGDAVMPRHTLDRRGLGAHRLGRLDRVHEETCACQQLAHLAGARADVGRSQRSALHRRVGTPSAPRGVDQRGHGLVRVGGAHGVVRTPLPDEGVHIECA